MFSAPEGPEEGLVAGEEETSAAGRAGGEGFVAASGTCGVGWGGVGAELGGPGNHNHS